MQGGRRWSWAVLLLVAGTTGCPDAEDEALARRVIAAVPDQSVDELVTWFAPSVLPEAPDESLSQLQDMLRLDGDLSFWRVDYRVTWTLPASGQRRRIQSWVFHVKNADRAVLVYLSLEPLEDRFLIHFLHVEGAPVDLASRNPLTLSGLSWVQYLVVVFAVVVLALTLATLVLVYRSNLRRKWAWMLLAVVAVGRLQVALTPIDPAQRLLGADVVGLVLMGVGLVKSPPWVPWVLSVGFPLGAMFVLLRLAKERSPRTDPGPRGLPAPQGHLDRDPGAPAP